LATFAGLSIAKAAGHTHPGVPIVIVSGLMEREELQDAFAAYMPRVQGFFQKSEFANSATAFRTLIDGFPEVADQSDGSRDARQWSMAALDEQGRIASLDEHLDPPSGLHGL